MNRTDNPVFPFFHLEMTASAGVCEQMRRTAENRTKGNGQPGLRQVEGNKRGLNHG